MDLLSLQLKSAEINNRPKTLLEEISEIIKLADELSEMVGEEPKGVDSLYKALGLNGIKRK